MRLAVYHNLTSGGSKREVFELTKRLHGAGHAVDLYTPTTANETFLPLAPYVAHHFVRPLHLKSDVAARLPLIRRYVDMVSLLGNLRALQSCARSMATEIDSRSYDFVFVHHDRLVQSPYLLRYLRTPSVYYCAEPMRQFYEPTIRRAYLEPASFFDRAQRIWYGPAVSARNRMIRDVDARNVHHATLLLTNSYFSAESIYRAYGLRARVCYLGVDTARFRPLGRERDNVVLSVGAVSPMKGYDFLIESIGLLPREHRPALVIVGNTSSAAETCYLNEMARQRGVAIRYEIDVSEDELVGWYNRVRAFVYAPVLEPFGLAPIEAIACGTPVVAVKEGGVRESMKEDDTALLVPRDAAAFAQALDSLRARPALWEHMSRRGREEALRFWDWKSAYHRFHDIVVNALGLSLN